MRPRLSVMLVNFFRPGILRTVMSSLPLRYSIGGTSTSRPDASMNDPRTAWPSSLMPLTTTRKLYPP